MCRCTPSLAELFATDKPDGIILATPNQMHVDGGLECVAAGVPVLVEKPIGDNVDSATRLVEAGEKAGVPVLTGHHRNYSPIMAKAREIVQSGVLGTLVGVTGTALFYKPDDYFDVGGGWRREPGGGPILLNLTHEVNNLLSLLGDIDTVIAMTSNSTRGFPVEDTSAMIFRFANGALGTFLLSDTAASARSWEQTSRENTSYASYDDEDAYHIAGTQGSLSVPTMRVKTYDGERSWWEPFTTSTETVERSDPLANQVKHFADVIHGAGGADLQRPRRTEDHESGRRRRGVGPHRPARHHRQLKHRDRVVAHGHHAVLLSITKSRTSATGSPPASSRRL